MKGEIMTTRYSRRSFLKGAAISAAGIAGVGTLAACGQATEAKGAGVLTYDQSIKWDGQYDVVVVGFGAAGACTSITAADEGARVLLLDKAPLGHEGGNTRYCGQIFVNGRGDVEATKAYYRSLYGEYEIDEDVFNAYTEGIANISDNFAETFELDKNQFVDCTKDSSFPLAQYVLPFSPEYPEFAVNDSVCVSMLHEGVSDAYLWGVERAAVVKRKDMIDVWLETPATRLIQEPLTKTILGVEVNRKGETLNIRATDGVVMTLGGFENNKQMIQDFLGQMDLVPFGTTYNTGDGIVMCQEIGADFWHTHAFETPMLYAGAGWPCKEGEQAVSFSVSELQSGSVIMVGTDGYRFLREDLSSRHGHVYANGEWENPKFPARMFIVYDQTQFDIAAESMWIKEELYHPTSAPTIAELGDKIGTVPGVLERTVADFNSFAAAGYDPVLQRPAETMRAFDDGPYYALELFPGLLNTQGGPRRNANAEIVDPNGNPIPHLYSSGEFGGVAANMYNGGGNMAECLIFGQIAGKNAARKKDPLGAFVIEPVESDIAYTPGTETDLEEEKTYETGENEYIGKGVGIGGNIVVKVKVIDGTIETVEVLEETETPDRGGKALKALPQEVLDAQSAQIDVISGATVTCTAFIEAVEEALGQAE